MTSEFPYPPPKQTTLGKATRHARGDAAAWGVAPVLFPVNVSELPFKVAAVGHYRVRAVVERGETTATWEGEVLIVDVEPLTVNHVWTPADLHLHSTFALVGQFTPAELAPKLANRGYAIGYITDEPVRRGITTQPLSPQMSETGRRGYWAPDGMGEVGVKRVVNLSFS